MMQNMMQKLLKSLRYGLSKKKVEIKRDKYSIKLSPDIIEILEGDKEKLYSPQIINYLINEHIGELEDIFLSLGTYWCHLMGEEKYLEFNLLKIEFIDAIEKVYKDGKMSLLTYLKTRRLRKETSFKAFLNKHGEETHQFIRRRENVAEQNEDKESRGQDESPKYKEEAVNIPIIELIEILLLPYEELERRMKKNPFGLSREEFAYAALSYFKLSDRGQYTNRTLKHYMFNKYKFPTRLVENIEKMAESIEITLIEEEIQQKPRYLKDVIVSDELWNHVMNNMPSNFNELEKAYYIYYKLCKTLTYSKSFFAWAETAKISYIGLIREIEDLQGKNMKNNTVVCFEILSIYAKFLEHLKIDFDIGNDQKRSVNTLYKKHNSIRMKISGKYFVEADPTAGVVKGDMPLAKENRPLKGFVCKNKTKKVQAEFQASIDKVHSYIWNEERNKTSFFDVLSAYKALQTDPVELSPEEKLSIIVNSISQTDLSQTDSLVYVTELTRLLFPDGSCDNYFILDHENDIADAPYSTVGIPKIQIVLRYQVDKTTPIYFIYSNETGLEQKTHEELQTAFDKERYEYLHSYEKEIPNIPKKAG